MLRSFAIAVLLLCCCVAGTSQPAFAQYPAACDKDKSCVGNAISITATAGKAAQYVDIDTSYRFLMTDTAMTFEAWILPSDQPGKVAYLAGLWGPNKDNNDCWVVYLQDTKIVFALSRDNSYKGDSDNTIAVANVPDLYTKGWRHVAVEWDHRTTEARIFLDGVLVAAATNPLYPLTVLHHPENKLLPMQIASTNALYDDTLTHRTFKGMIDEIRLWSRSLSPTEIQCQRFLSLNGNEPGLEMYFRCNEQYYTQYLCDATGHDHVGRLRSGAICDSSGRQMPPTYHVSPTLVNTKITCIEDSTLTFTITDTAFCGSTVLFRMYGPDAGLFTLSKGSASLSQNLPITVDARLHTTRIGVIQAGLMIANANRCGDPIFVPITLNRVTELSYTTGELSLDTIYVGCQDQTYSEKSVTICNPTARTIRLDSIYLDSNHFVLSVTPAITFPYQLTPGSCVTITARMGLIDSTHTFLDTLRIISDEMCVGSGVLAVEGTVQDVFGLLRADGKTPLDSIKFETVCPGMISNSQTYQYRSLGSDTVRIDSIYFSSTNFFGQGFLFPIRLIPKRAYLPTFVRFRPTAPGPFIGTITFLATYRGCHIRKVAYLTGRGYSVDVDFEQPSVDFGNVTIGKIGTQTVNIKDNGTDVRFISSYLKVGDVFTITAGKSVGLSPGQSSPITIAFRPRAPITYYDTLCIFDRGCYQTNCIPIQGTGIFDAFSFDPPFLDLENVAGCQSQQGAITIKNISGQTLTVTSVQLSDSTGKFSVQSMLPTGPMPDGKSFVFLVTYTPNDLTQDRADNAYIDITLSDGEVYHMLLRASSVAPRLYVTPLTTYGIVEVGWQKQLNVLIENASQAVQRVTAVTPPPGYQVLSTSPPLPALLAPRDSLWATIEFKPTGDSDYFGAMTVAVDSPCVQTYQGTLTGTGKKVKLQVPVSFMNYGIVKPCDCATREIPLANYSNLLPLTVDSIWIDGFGVTAAIPSTFSWVRKSTGTSTLPFSIEPNGADTLEVSFCPNIPATLANQVKNDTLHIMAHSAGWSSTFRTLLSGRRELNFQPNTASVTFPATRVDTSATPLPVTLSVPDVLVNPSGDSVVITGVTFAPDQGVFTAAASTGAPLPWVVYRNKKFKINVGFHPRQPKTYVARMQIHTAYPCLGIDTTVLVTGSGFAPAFGLQLAFDTARIGQDTIRLTTCDTLVLPIVSTRDIPQKYIDMYFHLGYDTSSLSFLDVTSPYTATSSGVDTVDGVDVHVANAVDARSGQVATVRLKVKGGTNAFPISLDNIYFDSDSLVYFKIIAGLDHGWIMIEEPQIAVSKWTDFDTVDIKQCKDQLVTIYNPSPLPIRFDSLAGLPKWHTITASSVPLPAVIQPGDSIQLTVTFCPRAEEQFDTTIWSYSNQPCPIVDTGTIHSFGYAPPFPFTLSVGPITTTDSIGMRIADTIDVPILIDKDIPQTPLDLRFSLHFNRRLMEFLDATSTYAPVTEADSSNGDLIFSLVGGENWKQGTIAQLRFLLTVPDSVTTSLGLIPGRFTSDSAFWIKPMATGDTAQITVAPRCDIARLVFQSGSNSLGIPRPNPASGKVTVNVQFVQDAAPTLGIFDEKGALIAWVLDGDTRMQSGSYELAFSTSALPSGVYHLQFHAGQFSATRPLIIVH